MSAIIRFPSNDGSKIQKPKESVVSCPPAVTRREAALAAAGLLLNTACSAPRPAIEFTRVPPADNGGPDAMEVIEGRVKGAKPGQ